MNRALVYLWFSLLKRKTIRFCADLRRPTKLIGFVAVVGLVGFMFHHRHHQLFDTVSRREVLLGCALVMAGGSLFQGFLQRGLVFEPADMEFLFTGPFSRRQIVFYRLLPHYLFAIVQGLVFLALFATHLRHPLLTTISFVLFQAACFHITTGAAIFAGSISAQRHHRICWMMLGAYFILTAAYLRTAWDVPIIPSFMSSPLAQILFYPAVTLSDPVAAPVLQAWTLRVMGTHFLSVHEAWQPVLYLVGFAAGAAVSLWLLFTLKADVFEISLAATTHAADRRLRVRQGRSAATRETQMRSVGLPGLALFRGVGAIAWKNLLIARRSKRELILAFVFTLVYTGFLIAIRWALRDAMSKGGGLSAREVADFDLGIAALMGFLAFVLQWTFRFDFRGDGHHLVDFRTLPVSPFALALTEIAVPSACCLAFQSLGIVVLMIYARFDWPLMLLMLLAYPAVALGLNAVWNVHYLLAAVKGANGKASTPSAVGTLVVVALSFLIFYPAGWTGTRIAGHFVEAGGHPGLVPGLAVSLVVQYLVDLFLVLMLARLFQRFEVSRDFQ